MCYILNMNYDFQKDVRTIRELLGMTFEELAQAIGVSSMTLKRWESGQTTPSPTGAEALYAFAYHNSAHPLRLNVLKSQFREEEKGKRVLLFHGASSSIEGPIDTHHTKPPVDFGDGFYAGESYQQAGSWVAARPSSSVYGLYFSPSASLCSHRFQVDLDWLLAVAHFRGRIPAYEKSPRVLALVSSLVDCDYLIAPIADNTMYETIDSFLNNLITSEQCLHCLAATDLGNQYVFLKEKACQGLELTDRFYLSQPEREHLLAVKEENRANGLDKVKAALIAYRGKGRYLEELLKDESI